MKVKQCTSTSTNIYVHAASPSLFLLRLPLCHLCFKFRAAIMKIYAKLWLAICCTSTMSWFSTRTCCAKKKKEKKPFLWDLREKVFFFCNINSYSTCTRRGAGRCACARPDAWRCACARWGACHCACAVKHWEISQYLADYVPDLLEGTDEVEFPGVGEDRVTLSVPSGKSGSGCNKLGRLKNFKKNPKQQC